MNYNLVGVHIFFFWPFSHNFLCVPPTHKARASWWTCTFVVCLATCILQRLIEYLFPGSYARNCSWEGCWFDTIWLLWRPSQETGGDVWHWGRPVWINQEVASGLHWWWRWHDDGWRWSMAVSLFNASSWLSVFYSLFQSLSCAIISA